MSELSQELSGKVEKYELEFNESVKKVLQDVQCKEIAVCTNIWTCATANKHTYETAQYRIRKSNTAQNEQDFEEFIIL